MLSGKSREDGSKCWIGYSGRKGKQSRHVKIYYIPDNQINTLNHGGIRHLTAGSVG